MHLTPSDFNPKFKSLLNDNNLALTKLKSFADDKFNVAKNDDFCLR